jgi:hypothetical protein
MEVIAEQDPGAPASRDEERDADQHQDLTGCHYQPCQARRQDRAGGAEEPDEERRATIERSAGTPEGAALRGSRLCCRLGVHVLQTLLRQPCRLRAATGTPVALWLIGHRRRGAPSATDARRPPGGSLSPRRIAEEQSSPGHASGGGRRLRGLGVPAPVAQAGEGTRTPDPLFTRQALYQLSYSGAGIPSYLRDRDGQAPRRRTT